MLRIKQLVPTVALTLATATLVTPAAQARLTDASRGSSPQSLSTHAFSPVHRGPAPGLGSSQSGLPHWGTGTFGRDVTAGRAQPQNSPLKNQLSVPADAQTSVTAPSTNSGFDWTAAISSVGRTPWHPASEERGRLVGPRTRCSGGGASVTVVAFSCAG